MSALPHILWCYLQNVKRRMAVCRSVTRPTTRSISLPSSLPFPSPFLPRILNYPVASFLISSPLFRLPPLSSVFFLAVPRVFAIMEYAMIISYGAFHLSSLIDVRHVSFLCYPRTCSGECEPLDPDNFAKGGKYEHCRAFEYNQLQAFSEPEIAHL